MRRSWQAVTGWAVSLLAFVLAAGLIVFAQVFARVVAYLLTDLLAFVESACTTLYRWLRRVGRPSDQAWRRFEPLDHGCARCLVFD